MALSFDQIRDVWIRNGGDPNKANTAAAIALAESGGNPDAISKPNRDGTIDRGLWQINSIHGALRSTTNLDANAKAAVAISGNGADWNPWTVFTSGAYRKYLNGNPDSAGGIPEESNGLSLPNPLDALRGISDIAGNVGKAGAWVSNKKNVIRVAEVVGGLLLMALGFVILAHGTIEQAVSTVSSKLKEGASVAAMAA